MRYKILVLTSNSLRHRYCIDRLTTQFEVVGAMSEPKKNYFIQARTESAAIEQHFAKLSEAEKQFFADALAANAASAITPIEMEDINSPEAVEIATRLAPDAICLFGTSILKAPWLEAFPDRIINLHLGLSPYYRGAATLFWPFHDSRLECLGTTIHLAIAKVDAGAILKRIKPHLEVGDTYYGITTRLIRDSLDQFPSVAQQYLDGAITPFAQESYPQARVTKKADFNEAALTKALTYVGEGLTPTILSAIARSTVCPC